MKDNSLVEDVEKLENLVKKGDFYKEKLARSTTLDDIKQIENECEALPFDLAHAFIEHKARINLGGAKKEIRTAESSLKEDQIDPTRKSNIIAIEKIITHDPNFK